VTGLERGRRRRGWLMLTPALTVLALLTLYPGLWVLWLSLRDEVPIFGVSRFTGLRHYAFLFGDARFLAAAWTTAAFTVASVALETVLGVLAAVGIAGLTRGRRLALSFLLLAWAMPAVVTAKIFEWLYHPAAGLVNYVLGGIALNWLGDPRLALPAVILADAWRTMPFVAVLAYARLLGIPPELYEAAQVDGASRLATFTRVTLPLLRPVLMIAVLFRTLDALRAFDIMFVLTGGGPANVTETLTVYAYRALFQMLDFGIGSAIGVIVFGAVMAVAWIYLRMLRLEEA
jgi:ABC-type sugar transport system permease subunit